MGDISKTQGAEKKAETQETKSDESGVSKKDDQGETFGSVAENNGSGSLQ